MNTDKTWQWYGENDPYYGVLTKNDFRIANLTDTAKAQFFATGERHIETLLMAFDELGFHCDRKSALDFGCGVGRLLLPLAERFNRTTGVDVSSGMLAECHRNAISAGVADRIHLVESDDSLSGLRGHSFDLVHSFIVLQHIPYERGLVLVRQLLGCVNRDGVACLHIQYAGFPYIHGLGLKTAARRIIEKFKNPLFSRSRMLMNAYPLNQVFEMLDELGFANCRIEFTKTTRGGVFILAQRTCLFKYQDIF